MKHTMTMVKLEQNRISIPEHCEQLRADFIRPGYKWIRGIEENQFAEVTKARKFCTDEVWEMYELLGEEDLVEVKDLKKALFIFRTAIVSRQRPDFYKLTKRGDLLKKLVK